MPEGSNEKMINAYVFNYSTLFYPFYISVSNDKNKIDNFVCEDDIDTCIEVLHFSIALNCTNQWDNCICEDRNECLDGTAACGIHSYCENLNGGFICLCDSGYTNTPGNIIGYQII